MKQASVVIPNYNGIRFLKDCMESLLLQDTDDFEIIIVDNGSNDESVKFLKENYPDVRIIKLNKNYGFCKAVNEGIKASKLKYVMLLNNDMTFDKSMVREMIQFMESKKNAFSCQAKMLQMLNPDKTDDAGDYYCALGWAFARGKDKASSKYNTSCKIFASCGGAAIYRREYLNKTGLFDEEHFAYLEDIDLGYRARILGYDNYYNPKALVYHYGSGVSGSRHNEFKVLLASRNALYMAFKNMPFIQLIINLPFLFAGHIIKIIFFARKGLCMAYIKGIADGIKLCRRDKKFPFKFKNLPNYIRIQLELWINIIKRVM